MMTQRIFAAVAVALLACSVAVYAEKGEKLTSGPQVDQKVPGPFHPLNVTGDKAGEKNCLFCSNGDNPVAMIFARQMTPGVVGLIKQIDKATIKNKGCDMGSFVVFLSDEAGLEKELKSMAEKEKLSKIVLSIDNPAGPAKYNVSKDADVTVVLYTKRTVKANYALKNKDLSPSTVGKIVADISKITPTN